MDYNALIAGMRRFGCAAQDIGDAVFERAVPGDHTFAVC